DGAGMTTFWGLKDSQPAPLLNFIVRRQRTEDDVENRDFTYSCCCGWEGRPLFFDGQAHCRECSSELCLPTRVLLRGGYEVYCQGDFLPELLPRYLERATLAEP